MNFVDSTRLTKLCCGLAAVFAAFAAQAAASDTTRVIVEFKPGSADKYTLRLRKWAVWWVGLGGFLIIIWNLIHHLTGRTESSSALITLLTPANLFTGVLACGFICLLGLWTDSRWLPRALQMPLLLRALTAIAGLVFLGLGLKGYWDYSGWRAFGIFAVTLAAGWLLAWTLRRARR